MLSQKSSNFAIADESFSLYHYCMTKLQIFVILTDRLINVGSIECDIKHMRLI